MELVALGFCSLSKCLQTLMGPVLDSLRCNLTMPPFCFQSSAVALHSGWLWWVNGLEVTLMS